jgi:hypothetical protein
MCGTSTFVLVSQIQKAETETICNAEDQSEYAVAPDSITMSKVSSMPDAESLKKMGGGDTTEMDMNTGGGNPNENELSEFSVPMGINLGSNEVGVTEYVTILFDENSVGFAISIPLAAFEKNKDDSGNWDGGDKKNPKISNKEAWTQYSDFFSKPGLGDGTLKDALDTKKNSTKGDKDYGVESGKFSAKLSFCLAFMWQYNPLDNGYYFSQFSVGVAGELQFRLQARLTVFPPVYCFLDIKGSLELKTGLSVIRTAKDDTALIDARTAQSKGNSETIVWYSKDYTGTKRPQAYSFETDKKAFNVRFEGKMYMKVQVKDGEGWKDADKDSGYLSGVITSDGSADTQVVFKQKDGMDLDETVRIVLRAMKYDEEYDSNSTRIIYLAKIKSVYDFVHWNGISIAPGINIEAGAGIGADLLKLELYLHFSIGAKFLLGVYNQKYDPDLPKSTTNYMYDPASVESFEVSIGIAMRVVLILFTYEMEFVSYQISYDGDKWEYGWHFLNDLVENKDKDKDKADTQGIPDENDNQDGVMVRLPQNKSATQLLFSPEDNAESEMSTQAYNPTDTSVPFQVSGYGWSADAANLSTGIPEGSQYKVVRAGEKNYIVYTLSRNTKAPEDGSQLVLSELGYANGKYGLINPVDSTSETKYIPLDT